MSLLQNSNAISSGGYDINNSLRFRSSASAYLNRTPASAGNLTTWTWSGWVKRGYLGSNQNTLFFADSTTTNYCGISFQSDTLDFANRPTGGVNAKIVTTQVFRDPSAWYHIVLTWDSTNATSSDRVRLYVNGSRITSFTTATYPSQNTNSVLNTAIAHEHGAYVAAGGSYGGGFDGYMTEINFIDGQALTPSSFGATDAVTGSWVAKKYTGTYGTNGFYLNFSDTSALTTTTNVGLGKDFSGNTNYWTTNNISVTAGTTYDAMIDSPTLTSATVSNYCTLNPILENAWWAAPSRGTISDGNLRLVQNNGSAFSTFDVNTNDKWYFEITSGVNQAISQIVIAAKSRSTFEVSYTANANKVINGSSSSYGASWTNGDVIGVAIDRANNQITFYKNNVSQGAITNTFPAVGVTVLAGYYAEATATDTIYFNFGQRPFAYTPPTGFVRLNTYNLPDSTIKKGNTVMDATLWTGTSSNQNIVNAGQFKPDFAWIKIRNTTGFNVLVDSLRVGTGGLSILASNATDAEATTNLSSYVTGFNSNGVALGNQAATSYFTNTSGNTFVGWQWQAGQGSTSSNTQGSITSTVSVNTTAGFSIVTYTGTGANATVGHGLGVAPKWFFIKARGAAVNWTSYHEPLGNTAGLHLNTTGGTDVNSGFFNNTSPNSTTFAIGSGSTVNTNGGTYVAYCWAEIAGYSAFGSYTGNGSTDGTFVYLGFRPKFILYKNASYAGTSWAILDSSRNTYNVLNARLFSDSSSAEDTSVSPMDFTSNGFKVRSTNDGVNRNGNTIIYMAFAESPFKNSLAR